MPTGTVIKTNPDGSLVIRGDDGKTVTVAAKSVKPVTDAAPEFKLRSEVAPENARFPKLGPTGYKAADFITNMLPGAGAVVGGTVGSPTGLGAILGAGAGAMTGDEVRKQLNDVLYKDIPKESTGDAAIRDAEQFALGAGSEAGARGASGLLNKFIKPFAKSAETVKAADAGSGVRLTPGEATDSGLMKRGETVMQHLLPGGGGPLEKFRVAQEGDVEKMLDAQLKAISPRELSSEEVGKRVQDAVKQSQDKGSRASYTQVKQMLGLKPDATSDEIEAAISREEKPRIRKDATGNPVMSVGRDMSSARGKVAEASRLYADEKKSADVKMVGSILKTNEPEIIGNFFQKKMGTNALRDIQKVLPPEVKQDIGRNVFQNMLDHASDAQTGAVNARSLATSLKTLGEGRGRLIFGNQYESIRDASALLNRITTSPQNTMMGTMHTMRLLGEGATALGAVMGLGGMTGLIETLGPTVAFSRMASLALTHPKYTAAALKVLRGMAVSSARSVPFVANEFQSPAMVARPTMQEGIQ